MEGKKVIYKKWVNRVMVENLERIFLQFGLWSEDGTSVTCAIIEKKDGTVDLAHPEHIQFIQ